RSPSTSSVTQTNPYATVAAKPGPGSLSRPTTLCVVTLMRPRKLPVVAYQTESPPNAIAGELRLALLISLTVLVAGSMRVTPGPGTQPPATQMAWSSPTISRHAPPSGMVATMVSVLGLIRTTALIFWTPTQIEPAPTARIVAGSGNVMTAVTASVVGSILATVRSGPLEIQIEPKPATTSWADGRTSVATRVPPGGSSDAGFRILFAARAASPA